MMISDKKYKSATQAKINGSNAAWNIKNKPDLEFN